MEFRLDFLLCTERCGSNLVTRMMDSHPLVSGPPPSHLVRTFSQNILRYGDLADDASWHALVHDVADLLANQLGIWNSQWKANTLPDGMAERSLATIIRHVYQQEATLAGKTRAFVKENRTYLFLPYILTAFPEAKVLYLVRDPRDMALSWKRSPNHPGRVMRATEIWHDDQERSLHCYGYLRPSGKVLLVRYEDLLDDSEREMRRVCTFLDITYEPSVLEFHRQPSTLENADRLQDWENLAKPIIQNNQGKFRDQLTDLEVRYIESHCGAQMDFLGYERQHPPGDLEHLRARLTELEEGAPAQTTAHLPAEEERIRQRRLAIIRRIANRRMDSSLR